MRARFVTSARYAFSNGGWAGYAMATSTALDALPTVLTDRATVPVAARAFMRAHAGFVMRGVSEVR